MQKILNLKQGTQKAMFFVFFLLCSTVMLAQNKHWRKRTGGRNL